MNVMENATASSQNRATVAKQGEREIHIERIFNATRSRVWATVSNPQMVAQWWGASMNMKVEKLDMVRGGYWRFVDHGAHGPQGFGGRYREVTPEMRIVQTFEWDGMPGHVSVETMTLEDLGDGRTKMVVNSQFHTTEERDGMLGSGMEGGLNASYDALDALLAAKD